MIENIEVQFHNYALRFGQVAILNSFWLLGSWETRRIERKVLFVIYYSINSNGTEVK